MFLNAIGGTVNNFTNNQFLARYKENEPYFYIPTGLSFTPATRLITGTPKVSGTFSLSYTATDSQLSTSAFISLVVSNSATVSPPATETTYQISAKVQNSAYVLIWSSKPLICPASSRLSGDAESGSGSQSTVWPRPSDGNFEIGYQLDGGKPGELSILDVSGRGLYHKSVEGEGPQSQHISLTDANGFFLIQLRQGNKIQSKKN